MEILLFTEIVQWDTRHQHCRNKRSKNASLGTIFQTRPTEDIEIARAVHVFRVINTSVWVDKVVCSEYHVPRVDKVDRNVVCDLQVTVHTEETRENTIDRIVERDAVQCIDWAVAKEELVVGCRDIHDCRHVRRREHKRRTSASANHGEDEEHVKMSDLDAETY